MTNERLGQTLLARRLITEPQLRNALDIQTRTNANLGEILLRCGYVSEEMLVRALAAQFGLQPWNLRADAPTPEALALVSPNMCREWTVLPVQLRGDLLYLAMGDPRNAKAIEAVRNETGLRVEPVFAFRPRLERAIEQLGEGGHDIRLDHLVVKAMGEVDPAASTNRNATEIANEIDTRPVVGVVNQILTDAIRMHASDIHIEPRQDEVNIRFRIDGRLVAVDQIPNELLPMVATRIKIMAELDIVEFRMPQDGRIAVKLDGRQIDLRVSILPNYHGPKIVLRLHDRSHAVKPMTDLGFDPGLGGRLRTLATKPYGMILVTGPTGSGKTTTLYSVLREVQDDTLNIVTAEDPIEFDLPGINQSQVNEKVGLTFAEQLRAILRQDPDLVLVGEIRDQETAEIALRASMTGHLLLSTLHTNDAMSAVPRLVDIGVNPYLLSTSLIGVLAQRLVRRLCPHCKRKRAANDNEKMALEGTLHQMVNEVHEPVGCARCFGTGYRGRLAIAELLTVDRGMSELIAAQAPMEHLRRHASATGFQPISVDAATRVANGVTSFDEISRQVFFEDVAAPGLRAA